MTNLKMIVKPVRASVVFICTAFLSSTLLAQTLPDAGSILRQQEQTQPSLPGRFPESEPEETVKPALKEDSGIRILVKSIHFTGATELLPPAELNAIVADAIGQTIGFNELQSLVDQVTQHLQNAGWLLARAYLPRQDVTEGDIEIAILKGRLDGSQTEGGGWQINLSEQTRIHSSILQNIAEKAASSGSSLQKQELERALLLMNDLPGISANSRLAPGRESGTTQVIADIDEGPMVSGNIWADNYGNNSTGDIQANGLVNINDPFGYGDHGSVSATKSKGIRLVRLGYDLPLNSNGLRGAVGYTDMRYEVMEGTGTLADLKGDSQTTSLSVSYPFIRSRLLNLNGSLGYNHKALKDESNAGTLRDKRINVFDISLHGDTIDKWGGGGINRLGLTLTRGDLDLSRVASDKAADAATLNTDGNYSKLGLNASRLQRLPGAFTLLGKFSAQLAKDNLDSSEEFILGGPNGVRAYPVSEAQGDEGWLANVELHYDWPTRTPLGTLQLSSFIDTGHIRVHNKPGSMTIPTATGKNNYQLSGAGIGISVSQPGSHSLKLSWAHTLGSNDGRSITGKNADDKTDKSRFWLQGIVWF